MPEFKKMRKRRFNIGDIFVILLFLCVVVGVIIFAVRGTNTREELTRDEFYKNLEAGLIKSIKYKGVEGSANSGNKIFYGDYTNEYINSDSNKYESYIVILPDTDITKIDEKIANLDPAKRPTFDGPRNVSTFDWFSLITIVGGAILIGVLIFVMFRSTASSNNKAFDFAKSRARLAVKPTTTFKDVAGLDEEKEEVAEVVDFLKNPQK